jgi:hypothetical protein
LHKAQNTKTKVQRPKTKNHLKIADPENLWLRKDGALLITVRDNARLRIVTPDGIINTLAGKGPTSRHDYYGPISLPTAEP